MKALKVFLVISAASIMSCGGSTNPLATTGTIHINGAESGPKPPYIKTGFVADTVGTRLQSFPIDSLGRATVVLKPGTYLLDVDDPRMNVRRPSPLQIAVYAGLDTTVKFRIY
jgi:hypothetical protein